MIAFIARMEQCTQIEAAKHLVERYQLEIPSTLSTDLGLQAVMKANSIIIYAKQWLNGAMSNCYNQLRPFNI